MHGQRAPGRAPGCPLACGLLSADLPLHGGEYLFLPGGRGEDGESPGGCARRELREEAGVTARTWLLRHHSEQHRPRPPVRSTRPYPGPPGTQPVRGGLQVELVANERCPHRCARRALPPAGRAARTDARRARGVGIRTTRQRPPSGGRGPLSVLPGPPKAYRSECRSQNGAHYGAVP
ncbi:NUDIX domain-containing protein [Streptomyces chrestomyceticus]|uniref:NUDIX domain-containing protein n=1 Tax=Streptomyces chrestomyceticus TaxID=68185 RepID=UPI00369B733B